MSDKERREAALSVGNSAMLCGGFLNAVIEAFRPEPVCAKCGRRKSPHGRSLPYPRGYEGDCSCDGYEDAPRPQNLFGGEKAEVWEFVALNDPATILADIERMEALEASLATYRSLGSPEYLSALAAEREKVDGLVEALCEEHDAFALFSHTPDEQQRRHHKGHHEYADTLLREWRSATDALRRPEPERLREEEL